MSEQPNETHYSRAWVLRECEASLKRLGTGHVDIYYLHRDYNGMDLEEPLRAIDTLLRDGKIRYWGVSNFRGWRIAEVVHTARKLNMAGPVVCQPYYNLLNRLPEVEVLEACRHLGIGVVPYSPIARGVLSGKYAPGAKPAEGTRAGRGDKRILQTEFRPESLAVAKKFREYAESRGLTPTQFAIAWALNNRLVHGVIGGPRTLTQWNDYLLAMPVQLTAEDEAFVDSLVPAGDASTHGYNDPQYPLTGRRPRAG